MDKTVPLYLGFEEAERLLEAARSDKQEWFNMIMLALKTGLRIGELIALRWQDCDLSGRKLVVFRSETLGVESSPKNRKSRVVPLSGSAVDALSSQRHLRGACFLQGRR